MRLPGGRFWSSIALVGVVLFVLSPVIFGELNRLGYGGDASSQAAEGVRVIVATVEPTTARASTLMATVEPQTLTAEEEWEVVESHPEAMGYNLYGTATITLVITSATINATATATESLSR
ncbi:MAG: hypothetical protein QW569_05450 [Candidatus Bathyarchaeia archaeon]|nr:hypothetical protein [Candidatus Bathyarchaeota archaeon]